MNPLSSNCCFWGSTEGLGAGGLASGMGSLYGTNGENCAMPPLLLKTAIATAPAQAYVKILDMIRILGTIPLVIGFWVYFAQSTHRIYLHLL